MFEWKDEEEEPLPPPSILDYVWWGALIVGFFVFVLAYCGGGYTGH